MAQLDETISSGQTGHLSDHQQLAKKANYVFDVMDYGATGDGTTDDTAAIQAAVDAAETANGSVYPPVGTYLVSALTYAPVNNKNIGFYGDGYGTAFKCSSSGTMLTITPGSSNFQAQHIHDFRVDVNGQDVIAIDAGLSQHGTIERVYIGGTATSMSGAAIQLSSATLGHIRDVTMRLTGATNGIEATANVHGIVIEACEFIGMDTAITIPGSTALHIANNRFETLTVAGVVLGTSSSARKASIIGNRFEECILPISITGLDATSNRSQSITIADNYFTGIKSGEDVIKLQRTIGVDIFGNYLRAKNGESFPVGTPLNSVSVNSQIRIGGNAMDVVNTVGSSMTGGSVLFPVDDFFITQDSGDVGVYGDLSVEGNVGFYGTTAVAQQTGVAVSAAGIHAALVNLGLITA